ncbi:MAG: sigma-70 family RNA polymerase sigma factor [Verrucomicrobiales bacterium]
MLAAKDGEIDVSKQALEELALAYWKPIYAFLRGKGKSHEEAQDGTQGFFEHLLRRDFLRDLQPEGGRFRSFLLVSLRHLLIDEHRKIANVQQRVEISLEPWHEMEAIDESIHKAGISPEEAFDRSWAEALVERAMTLLQQRWEKRAALFAELRYTVESPEDVAKYADIALHLGMTEGAVGKAAYDFRKQFGEQIRKEIRETVTDEDDVEEELLYLVTLLRS